MFYPANQNTIIQLETSPEVFNFLNKIKEVLNPERELEPEEYKKEKLHPPVIEIFEENSFHKEIIEQIINKNLYLVTSGSFVAFFHGYFSHHQYKTFWTLSQKLNLAMHFIYGRSAPRNLTVFEHHALDTILCDFLYKLLDYVSLFGNAIVPIYKKYREAVSKINVQPGKASTLNININTNLFKQIDATSIEKDIQIEGLQRLNDAKSNQINNLNKDIHRLTGITTSLLS